MTWPVPFDRARLDLLVPGRISEDDARRQTATAEEIARRLAAQPGLVLADEVGMGKTFVALAVATAALWADKRRRPVVVMTPPGVQEKWQKDFEVFRDRCIRDPADRAFRCAVAKDAVGFFRLLDDPRGRRARLIFLTHGAFHRALLDPWVKLAILKRAMHHARLGKRRAALLRFAPDILRVRGRYDDPELYHKLLANDAYRWRELIAAYGRDPGDDPVPEAVQRALDRVDFPVSELRAVLRKVPLNKSANFDRRIIKIRRALVQALRPVWQQALVEAKFRSPLLVLDEAHHAKNPATRLASLFASDEAVADAQLLSGALAGGFERMLFLTATPFQLGHHELLQVISRFQGIAWTTMPDAMKAARFEESQAALRAALDEAQVAATRLDRGWGSLRASDVREADDTDEDSSAALEAWWRRVRREPARQPERVQQVVRSFERTRAALDRAGELLRPWVIRHLRPRVLPGDVPRRVRFSGHAIHTGRADDVSGIPITDSALLPFLLAARAQAIVGHLAREHRDRRIYRATFAEGLASTYETFLDTRRERVKRADDDGTDDGTDDIADERVAAGELPGDPRLGHYLGRLRDSLPSESAFSEHPKVAAVVARTCDLWERGEKSVVFCHYRVTGRALVRHISRGLEARLWDVASRRSGVPVDELRELARLWNESFSAGRPLERALREVIEEITACHAGVADGERDEVVDIARRFVRTETFLGRFVDVTASDRAAALRAALHDHAAPGGSLRARLESFVAFLFARLTPAERREYLDALPRIQPGPRYDAPDAPDEPDRARLLPNVRLANGAIPTDVRRRLLLGFNTPFLPEVLVASSVMAEGVDLHLNCRHVIHHDLDWNPSVIEQRTGRVDRIGARAEQVGRSIEVCLPYVAATQDEKMYRVVMDRERWFQVVMGEEFRTDEHSTEEAAERVPLPESAARELILRLEVHAR